MHYLTRHDASKAFEECETQKDRLAMEQKGIVSDSCFEVLFNDYNPKSDQGRLTAEELKKFLIIFRLATQTKENTALYIPALIPDSNREAVEEKLQEIRKSTSTRGFYFSFKRCDNVLMIFSLLLSELALEKNYFEKNGITFWKGFSAKIESRRLGTVAAMSGQLTWTEAGLTDVVEFVVTEKDCNDNSSDLRFARHKVSSIVFCPIFFGFCSDSVFVIVIGHMCLPPPMPSGSQTQHQPSFQYQLSLQGN